MWAWAHNSSATMVWASVTLSGSGVAMWMSPRKAIRFSLVPTSLESGRCLVLRQRKQHGHEGVALLPSLPLIVTPISSSHKSVDGLPQNIRSNSLWKGWGEAQNFALFFSLSLSWGGVFMWNLGGVFEGRDTTARAQTGQEREEKMKTEKETEKLEGGGRSRGGASKLERYNSGHSTCTSQFDQNCLGQTARLGLAKVGRCRDWHQHTQTQQQDPSPQPK